MRIIAYNFESECNCVDCTRKSYDDGRLSAHRAYVRDEHGLPQFLTDQDDNPVHPVFSTDELAPNTRCDRCMTVIN
jgi:hypothetical protein